MDAVAPTLTITDDVPGIVGEGGSVTFTFTFSEGVQGFDVSDIVVTGGSAGQLVAVSDSVYTLEVTPAAGQTGDITVSVAADAARDAAGNGSAAAEAVQPFDTDAPGADALSGLQLLDDVGAWQGEITSGMTTDDSKPSYVGKADPADVAKVQLLDNGIVVGEALVNADGSFSVEPDVAIGGGGHAFTLRPVDAAGNIGAETGAVDFMFDGAKPTAPAIVTLSDNEGSTPVVIQKDGLTNDSTPLVNGTGTAGTTIKVYDGNTVVGTTTVAADGTWSIELDPLTDGQHILTATATNAANVESGATGEYKFSVDTLAPAQPAMPQAQDNVGAEQGPITGGVTDDATPTLSGSGEPGESVTIYDNGVEIGTAVVNDTGNWSWTPATALGDGEHSLTTTLTDAAGNESAPSDALEFTVDTTALELSITQVLDDAGTIKGPIAHNGTTDDTTPTFEGKATAGAVVTIYEAGVQVASTTADAGGHWSITLPEQAEGTHAYEVKALNAAQDELSESFTLTVDTTPPAVPSIDSAQDDVGAVQGPLASGDDTDDTTPTLSGKGEPGVTVRIYDGSNKVGETTVKADGTWEHTIPAMGNDGEHSFTVTSVDAVGNESGHSDAFVLHLDTSAPDLSQSALTIDLVAGDDIVNATEAQGDITLSGTLSGIPADVIGTIVQVTVNGITYDAVVNGGTWSVDVPGTGLTADMARSVAVKALLSDAAGNEAELNATRSYDVDTDAPGADALSGLQLLDDVGAWQGEITSGMTTDDSKPSYVGKADPADVAKVQLLDNGIVVGEALVNADGSFSVEPDVAIGGGGHAFTLRPVDAAGNIGAETGAVDFMFDGAKPTAPAIVTLSDNEGSTPVVIQKDGLTNDSTPLVNGTGTAGTTIKVYDGNTVVGTTTVAADGTWSIELDPLTDGQHILTATATNAANVESGATGEYKFSVDTLAPAQPAMPQAQDNVGAEQGPITGGVTDDATPTLSGSGEPGESVTIYDNGVEIGTAVVNDTGNWSWTPATALGDGEHSLTTTLTDAAGNESAPSDALEFTVDTTALELSITQVLDDAGTIKGPIAHNGTTDDTTPTFEGKATAGAVVTIYEAGVQVASTTADAGGHWSITLPEQAEGTHAYEVKALNAAQDELSESFTLTVDTTPPAVPSIDSAQDDVGLVVGELIDGIATDDTTPTLMGQGEAGSTLYIYNDTDKIGEVQVQADGTWSFTVPALPAEGPYTFYATSVDAVGNESARSDPFTLILDTTPPDVTDTKLTVNPITADNILSATEVAGRVGISGTLTGVPTEGVSIVRVTVTVGDETYFTTLHDGRWSTSVPGELLLNDPDHVVEVVALITDYYGNPAEVTLSHAYDVDTSVTGLWIDNVLAEDNIINASEVQGVIISGSTLGVDNGCVVNVTISDGVNSVVVTGVVNGDRWTAEPADLSALQQGNVTVHADMLDQLGNPLSADSTVLIDTHGPTDPDLNAVAITSFVDNVAPLEGEFGHGTSTNDNSPLLKGTYTCREIGAKVKIYEGSNFLGYANLISGTWSLQLTNVPAGEHTYHAVLADGAGNEGLVSNTFNLTVDVTAPMFAPSIDGYTDDVGSLVGDYGHGSVTDDTEPLLKGSIPQALAAGEKIHVYRVIGADSELVGIATVQANGTQWSLQLEGLSDASHYEYVAKIIDAAGNVGPLSNTFGFSVDTQGPDNTVSIDAYEDDVGLVQGPDFVSGTTTDDNSPLLKGSLQTSLDAGDLVQIYHNGNLVGIADVLGANWTFQLTDLTDGTHKFTAIVTDKAGNLSSAGHSNEFVLTVDTGAPGNEASITHYLDNEGAYQGEFFSGSATDDSTPELHGTLKEPLEAGETIRIYEAGKLIGTATVNGTSWTYQLGGLTDGNTYSYTAVVASAAGINGNASAPFTISVDTTPPQFNPTITGYADDVGSLKGIYGNGTRTDDTDPVLYGTIPLALSQGELVRVYQVVGSVTTFIGNATVDGTTWSLQLHGLSNNTSYNYVARVVDSVGNEGGISNQFGFTIDTDGPSTGALISSYTDNVGNKQGDFGAGLTDDSTPQLNGTLTTNLNPGDIVQIYQDGQLLGNAIVFGANWSYQLGELADGTYTFKAIVADEAGNPSTQGFSNDFTITVDTSSPDVTASIDSYADDAGTRQGNFLSGTTTDDTSPVLNGTLSGPLLKDETIRIYQGGTLLGEATVNGQGWTFDVSGLEHGMTYDFTAVVTSSTGAEGDRSDSFILTVDTLAPTITTTFKYHDNVGAEQGDFGTGTTTDDRTPLLKGTLSAPLEAGDTVAIYEGATLLGKAQVNGLEWSFVLPQPLEDGSRHTYTAKVQDAAGNEGPDTSLTLDIDLEVVVNAQSTLDLTPIISGSVGFEIQPGEYVEVTVDGVTYSSKTGDVVVDMLNSTWYVEIPDANALDIGVYDVKAVLFDANGAPITTDDTMNELTVSETPTISFSSTTASSADTGTAITLGEDGTWRILSNSTVFTQDGTDSSTLGSFSSIALSGPDRQQQSTFIDFDRDGLMDILGADTAYANGQQSFKYDGSSYQAFQIGAYSPGTEGHDPNGNCYVWYGGVAGIDINGDGFVDIIYGDETPNDAETRGGYDTAFVMNTDGTIVGFDKSGAFVYSNTQQDGVLNSNSGNPTPDREVAGVDLNNDGYVDIVYHGTVGINNTNKGGASGLSSRLVVVQNGIDADGKVTLTATEVVTGVFAGDQAADNRFVSQTWADFNGDGYMDLFLGGLTGSGTGGAESTIYYNDGAGRLTAAANGVDTGANVQKLADTVNARVSLAVDWNGDGRMDVIEIAGENTAVTNANNIGLLWTNNGMDTETKQVNWTSETLVPQANLTATNFVTGALAVDLDFDGAQDLVVFRAQGGASLYIENKNKIEDGTSIILRVLDKNGINSFYGNTVMLIDEATGEVVASQIINAQSGVNTNNSTGLVYFYGLDSSKSYSAVLLSNGNDHGGVDSITLKTGTNAIENINSTWAGLKPVEANHAYVLTAESDANAMHSDTAATDATNTTGIVGTGYNDTLFATAGTHVYNGGGGSVEVSGVKNWSNTGGMDFVDYIRAGNTALKIDLSHQGLQDTGFGKAKFVNIEGISGGSGNDTFTDDAGNNFFEGRGGNDTFNLIHGGNDTLMYKLLNAADSTGGNGQDVVNGFTVGTWEATANADRIDLADLLVGYTPTVNGKYAAKYVNGIATIEAGDRITSYLKVEVSGDNTMVEIDRSGTGQNFTTLVTLNDIQTDLATLLANHQINLI
ncbi:Ig-like domain-containing protein [Diaphorobacter sp.]|uniref:Ig-like domain-containing protein n=1 Tax=Diaphorobacter sp. TaxID=1934310 RepID=UPI0028AB6347|nr:Ig-like domain-containing protein [Diaphorobacter sp.]